MIPVAWRSWPCVNRRKRRLASNLISANSTTVYSKMAPFRCNNYVFISKPGSRSAGTVIDGLSAQTGTSACPALVFLDQCGLRRSQMKLASIEIQGRQTYAVKAADGLREPGHEFRVRYPDLRSVLAGGAVT